MYWKELSNIDLYSEDSNYILINNLLLCLLSHKDFVINSSGNVGIGTTYPSKKLKVYGSDNVFEGILV